MWLTFFFFLGGGGRRPVLDIFGSFNMGSFWKRLNNYTKLARRFDFILCKKDETFIIKAGRSDSNLVFYFHNFFVNSRFLALIKAYVRFEFDSSSIERHTQS